MSKDDDDESLDVLTMRALVAARDAFWKVLEADGCDPAYWDIRFTAWQVDSSFTHRLARVEIEREVKE